VIHSSHTSDIASTRPQHINLGTASYSKGFKIVALFVHMAPYGRAAGRKKTEVVNLIYFELREDIARRGIFQCSIFRSKIPSVLFPILLRVWNV